MLFMTYRPKAAKNVRAERVTEKNINEVAASFAGLARVVDNALKIATFEGVLVVLIGEWVVRHETSVEKMTDEEFDAKYEKARTTLLRDS